MAAVSDNGCGMDEETLSHIFEPFFTTKKEGEGTGLGLAMVHGIVRQSGGHVYAYSEPGKGTTIKVYIPKTDEIAESEKEEKEPAAPPKGTETILLAEDEKQVRDFAKRVLENNGYRVLEAADGEEALRVLRSHRGAIQLLMTDVVMPKMNGPELAAHAADMRPDITVIYLSGYAESAITRNGVLEPGTVFLQKPVTVKALSRKVREVLDAARRPS
jgi:CheY-like chemotaxis protein